MIEHLMPYSSYRATGVYWLPQVPSHWNVVRSKHVFAERTELARAGDVQLSATQAYGVIPQAEFERRVGRRVVRISMHLDKRSHVEKGDFVISMRSFQGGLERAWASGAIRSSYVILRPARELDLGYFTHLFKAQPYIKALQATGNFIRDGQDLTFGNFSRVDLPVPALDEQLAIGRFLDHANRRIDQFIRAKKKLSALLNEQKQAIVHRAVTRGLEPSVKLKDSGVEWIGKVPEQWQVIAIGAGARDIQTGPFGSQLHAHDYIKGGIPLVNPAHMHLGRVREDQTVSVSAETAARLIRHRLVLGDIVVARRGDIGRSALVTEREAGWLCGTGSLVVRVKPETMLPEYFQLAFGSFKSAEALARTSIGTTMANINPSVVARHRLPVPPLAAQRTIVEATREQLRSTEAAARCLTTELQQISEYRTRLIADVVTGQLDVRTAAASLPDLGPDSAWIDPSDDETEIDDTEAA